MKKFVPKTVIISREQRENGFFRAYLGRANMTLIDKTAQEQFGMFKSRDTQKYKDKHCRGCLLKFYYKDMKFHLKPTKGEKVC